MPRTVAKLELGVPLQVSPTVQFEFPGNTAFGLYPPTKGGPETLQRGPVADPENVETLAYVYFG
jgi:hypothetical protein